MLSVLVTYGFLNGDNSPSNGSLLAAEDVY